MTESARPELTSQNRAAIPLLFDNLVCADVRSGLSSEKIKQHPDAFLSRFDMCHHGLKSVESSP